MKRVWRFYMAMLSRLRQQYLKSQGVEFTGKCWIQRIEIPRGHASITLAEGVSLDRGAILLIAEEGGRRKKIVIERETYINRYTFLDASDLIHIGANCMIGPFTYITDHDHTHCSSDGRPAGGVLKSAPVTLEPNCWLGAHVTVLKGVTIGRGAVIGAGSVVTKSIPAGATAVGNPARVIKGGAC
jgi:maltose O-acetyltransferase